MKSGYLRAMCVVFTFTVVFAVASATRELAQGSECTPERLQEGVSCELLYLRDYNTDTDKKDECHELQRLHARQHAQHLVLQSAGRCPCSTSRHPLPLVVD
jgi:hypothetical protein